MGERRYGHYCGLAKALDTVGERWVLLIVRELLEGPQRFTELREWLPGLSPTLLAQRLREMERAGVVERGYLPPPAASQVYQLTERGWDLGAAVDTLAKWGVELLGPPGSEPHTRPLWVLMSVCVRARRRGPRGTETGVHEVIVDGERHHVIVDSGLLFAHAGRHHGSASVIRIGSETLYNLAAGRVDLTEVCAHDNVGIEGDRDAAVRMLRILCPLSSADVADSPSLGS